MSKKYDSYKDSGIQWIGEIPSHWDRIRIKNLVSIKVTDGPHETPQWTEDGIPFISAEAIKGNQIDLNFKRGFISEEQHHEYCKKSKVLKGDILFCKSGSTTGKSALVDTDIDFGIWSPLAIIRANINKINNKYLFQSIQSSLFQNQVETAWTFGTQPNIGMGALENLWIAIPSQEEQTIIANFLDHKTSQIDDLITKKERLIQLLEEERTAIINQAVTKGLDPKVPMKDSGIDGLGLIPLNWKLMKFKMFAPILTCGVASTPEYVDESVGVPFLSAQNVKNNRMRLDNYKHISTDLHNSLTKNRKPQNGDILVTRVGAGIGDACIVDCNFEFSVYVSLTHIRVDESIVKNKFIMYFFSTDYCKYLNSQGTVTGGGVGNLNVNNVERYKVPIPPLEEQELIVDFITSKSTEIDKIVFKTQQEIELLKEYKTALISEVVTGKVDVRDELIKQPIEL